MVTRQDSNFPIRTKLPYNEQKEYENSVSIKNAAPFIKLLHGNYH